MYCSPSIWTELVILIITVISLTYAFFKWRFSYWNRRNIANLPPKIPFGNSANPFTSKHSFGVRIKNHYDTLKSRGFKHAGIYLFIRRIYFPIDPEYIKNILAKDFNYFMDRGIYYNEKDDPISAHLLTLEGAKWRKLRAKLTPTFTSGKMKMMIPTFAECGKQLQEELLKYSEEDKPIDIKEVLGCFTTDVIGSCAFGLECNSFKKPDSPFREHGKKIFTRSKFGILKMIFSISFPNLARSLGVRAVPALVSNFFMNVVKDAVQYREEEKIKRNDFLQILIDLKNNKFDESEINNKTQNNLTLDQICAQSFVFFLAGFETSSTAMTFCLYELAVHQDIQQKVRDEINEVLSKHNDNINYEAVMDMKYLGQVIEETLRKYPPAPYIGRKCIKDYKLPNENVIIEKGVSVGISILGLHYDPDHFPDPEKFDPERFNDDNKKRIKPFTYMPFGEGPRNCIGLRFGLMQTKIGLIFMLKHFNFILNPRTETPLEMSIGSFVLTAKGGVWLNATAVSK